MLCDRAVIGEVRCDVLEGDRGSDVTANGVQSLNAHETDADVVTELSQAGANRVGGPETARDDFNWSCSYESHCSTVNVGLGPTVVKSSWFKPCRPDSAKYVPTRDGAIVGDARTRNDLICNRCRRCPSYRGGAPRALVCEDFLYWYRARRPSPRRIARTCRR